MPVPKRKKRAKAAPKMSPVLSGLTANLFGSGALKFGGGANVTDDDEEGDGEEEEPSGADALTENTRLGVVRRENGGRMGGGWVRFRALAMAFGAPKLEGFEFMGMGFGEMGDSDGLISFLVALN